MGWLDDNAGGNNLPGIYFGDVGDIVKGVISGKPRIVTVQDDRGKDVEKLVVELRALPGCTAKSGKRGADGPIPEDFECSLWIKGGLLATAVKDAVRAAGAKGLAEGDTIAVQYTDTKDTGKMEPAKVYAAKYVAAKPSVAIDDLI
jgi:hypothetical protein